MSRNKRMDALGDRLKTYERIETDQKFPPNTCLYVRLDGRSFSKFTKGLARPYDERMSNLMKEVTASLVKEFNATIGYTQSDEISLIINNQYDSPCIFEGKKQKLISTLSAHATAVFNAKLATAIPEKDPLVTGKFPTFDCRIFPVYSSDEAANAVLWREQDAIKNSVSMAAYHHFSHKQLHKVNTSVMKDMLKTQANVIWDDYPKFFKSGSYFQRIPVVKFVEDSDQVVIRHKIKEVDNLVLTDLSHEDRVRYVMNTPMCISGSNTI
jgi:tRNA(His) 5'-end guanylyltransferase